MTTNDTTKQSDPLHGPNLILDVENFGPIAQAKNIEFKPMTVFVGPSNTGKSYLATLNHAVRQEIQSRFPFSKRFFRFHQRLSEQRTQINALVDDVATQARLIETCVDDNPVIYQIPFTALNAASRSLIEQCSIYNLEQIRQDIIANVEEYFEITDVSDITSYHSSSILPLLRVRNQRDTVGIELISGSHHRDDSSSHFAINEDLVRVSSILDMFKDDEVRNEITLRLSAHIWNFINQGLAIAGDSYYFPTGRTGIMNAHRVLTSQIIANAGRHGIDQRQQINYHRLAREFLNMLVDVDQHRVKSSRSDSTEVQSERAEESPTEKVASVLQASVIEGDIEVIRSIGLPDFEYSQHGRSIPIFRASSMVTELAPIIMFLRSFATVGDLLIIDEPEAHLHPAAQQQMAAALAFMVRSGLRVLITTHSHYMVEQLGNFVAVSTLEPDLRKRVLKLGGALGEEDIYLDESEVAVYDFATDKAEHGSLVETVEFNQDYGYFPRDHNWAIADQMNRTRRVIEARIDQDDPVVK